MNASYKKVIAITLFCLLFQTISSQETVTISFTKANQDFDFSKDKIELEITVEKQKNVKIKFLELFIFNDSKQYKDALDGISNDIGFNKIIRIPEKKR